MVAAYKPAITYIIWDREQQKCLIIHGGSSDEQAARWIGIGFADNRVAALHPAHDTGNQKGETYDAM